MESLVPAILEQKVTGERGPAGVARPGRAATASRRPARPSWRLRVPPRPPRWPRCPTTPSTRSASSGAGPTLIRRVAARAAWFEEIVDLPSTEAYARLTALPGHRAVDRGRGRRPRARRRGRGERRRLPPAQPRGLRARRRAARGRRADARAARAVAGPARAGRPAARAQRDRRAEATARASRRVASSATDAYTRGKPTRGAPNDDHRPRPERHRRCRRRRGDAVHARLPPRPVDDLLRERILVIDGGDGHARPGATS